MSNNPNLERKLNARGSRYAVIGAGAAGLCMAKYLIQEGIEDVTVFEIGSQIGGLWCFENDNGLSSAYKTLHINTARNLTRFSDFPFREDVQTFPDHWDMHNYLSEYASHFDVLRRIRFRSRVVDICPADGYTSEDPKWKVTLESGAAEIFDRVVVASGHLSRPLHVDEFRQSFTGTYLHSHYYREPAPFVGKRVCVVGVGNSACDIASDICNTSASTTIVARSGVMIGPKLICGVPFTDLSMLLYRTWIPAAVRAKLLAFLIYLVHGRMVDLGFKPLTRRAHPTTNAVVVQHIAYRRIAVKQGITQIKGRRIYFADGSEGEFDALIAATGYLVELPFISSKVLEIKDNWLDLYKRIVAPAWRGLYFMGFFNTTTALNMIFEHQAQWVLAVERGEIRLPPREEMVAAIKRKREWIRRHYKSSPRHTIEEEHHYYIKELRVPAASRRIRRVEVDRKVVAADPSQVRTA